MERVQAKDSSKTPDAEIVEVLPTPKGAEKPGNAPDTQQRGLKRDASQEQVSSPKRR